MGKDDEKAGRMGDAGLGKRFLEPTRRPRGRAYVRKPFRPPLVPLPGRQPNSILNLPKRLARFIVAHDGCVGCKHTIELNMEDVMGLMTRERDKVEQMRGDVERWVEVWTERRKDGKV